MTYVNPARKALADAKRAMSKITMTTKCLGCSREFKKTPIGLIAKSSNVPPAVRSWTSNHSEI